MHVGICQAKLVAASKPPVLQATILPAALRDDIAKTFDKVAYQREYMKRRRAEAKK